MGKDVQVLKLEIQNHTVTVLYRTVRGPTLPPLYYISKYTTKNLLDKGPVVRSCNVFFYIILKNQIWSKIKSFVDFKLRVVIVHLHIISSWPFNQQT